MKAAKFFLTASGLMVLAFVLYVAAPAVRARLMPTPAQHAIAQPVPAPAVSAPAAAPLPVKLGTVHAAKKPAAAVQSRPAPAAAAPMPVATVPAPDNSPADANLPTAENADAGSAPAPVNDQPAPNPRYLKLNPNKLIDAFTIDVLPGQEVHFNNPTFSYVRIGSDYPVIVHIGACQSTGTTDLICNTMPNVDINFQDSRLGDPSAPVNRVRITALRDAP